MLFLFPRMNCKIYLYKYFFLKVKTDFYSLLNHNPYSLVLIQSFIFTILLKRFNAHALRVHFRDTTVSRVLYFAASAIFDLFHKTFGDIQTETNGDFCSLHFIPNSNHLDEINLKKLFLYKNCVSFRPKAVFNKQCNSLFNKIFCPEYIQSEYV